MSEVMKKVVVIGGGTGSFTVLRGLKERPYDISAIVSMFDSGGSSGVLRDEHGVLPPGDVRRCLVALSEGEQERTLRELFNYRFKKGGSLKGHTFGNILITALTEILGDEGKAINKAGDLLNIKGKVLPVSLEQAHLCAELEDGSVVRGETNIDIPKHDGNLKIAKVYLDPEVVANKEAVETILEADLIVIGPGDLYTSIIPNILSGGVGMAIKESKADKVFVLNLFTKWGETNEYKASDFAKEALQYIGIPKFDYIIYNSTEMPSELVKKYENEKKKVIEVDDLKDYTFNEIGEDVYSAANLLRHDSKKLARIIDKILK
jgi:uncharacterized cofD-like protein